MEEKVSDNIHLAMADKKKPDQSSERANVFAVGDRIEEAHVNHVVPDRNGPTLQVDFGHDETALVELWQVLED